MSNDTATLTNTVDTDHEAIPAREFSRFDKCDRCGFQAYFVATKDAMELTFCKHHGDDHVPALAERGWAVLDFTPMLDKPLVSANVD